MRDVRMARAAAAAAAVLALGWVVLPPVVAQGRPTDVSGTYEGEGHTLTYTVTGVEPGPDDQPYNHSGTVTGTTLTLTGTATFTIGEGLVTNLSMGASLAAGGSSDQVTWPPEGVDGRVGDTTVTFPFSLTVEVPPPPEPDPAAFPGETPDADAEPVPYTTASFSVHSRNCNDWGVCGGPSAGGTFQVFDTRTSTPTVDWIAAVGALGAAAAVAAALAGIGRTGDRDPRGRDRWRYVLQVGSDSLEVGPGRPASLDVQVWAVNAAGVALPATDASVTATPAGPFALSGAQGVQALHSGVTTGAPPGARGAVHVASTAGPVHMSTTVALRSVGEMELQLTPVGEPVLRPEPRSDRYTPVLLDARMLGGAPPEPVDFALTGLVVEPTGLVTVTEDPPAGPGPGKRLRVELTTDRTALLDPANRQVRLEMTAVPIGHPEPRPVTASTTLTLEPQQLVIHWREAGRPETTDQVLEVVGEAGTGLALEVWVETADGSDPPDVEFSHVPNVDGAGRQLPPTIADFDSDPTSEPELKAAGDNRAHSLWLVKRSFPSPDRPDLVPPVETAVRVRAWQLGSVTARLPGSLRADAPHLAQAVVPIRVGPVRLVVELVAPTEPVAADGSTYDTTLRVLRERDRSPYAGTVQVEVTPPRVREACEFMPGLVAIAPEDGGEIRGAVRTPDLTYRRDVPWHETLAVSLPAGPAGGSPTPIGDVPLALAPAVDLELYPTKKGLTAYLPGELERAAADRVAVLAGQLRARAAMTRPPEAEADVVVVHGTVAVVAPPDSEEKPTAQAVTQSMGRFTLALPGLTPVPGQEPSTITIEELAHLELESEVSERLDLYETRVCPRLERGPRPLGTLIGDRHADTLATWRLEVLRQLAGREEDRFDDVMGTVELAEAAAVYTDVVATVYYDLLREARDVLASLLGDAMNLAITPGGLGDKIAKTLGPWVRSAIDAIDSWVLRPSLTALRITLRKIIGVVDQLLAELPLESLELKRTLAEIHRLWDEITAGGDADLVSKGIELVLNAIAFAGRWIHGAVLGLVRRLLPMTDTMMRYLGPAMQEYLDPAWGKLAEETFKKIIDEIEALPWAAGGITESIKTILDGYPGLATEAVEHVLADLTALRVPADPALRREQLSRLYGAMVTNSFELRIRSAEIDDYLAWLNLASTLLQLILIFYAGVRTVVQVTAKILGKERTFEFSWVDISDIVTSLISGVAHLYEMTMALFLAYGACTYGTGAVKELTA